MSQCKSVQIPAFQDFPSRPQALWLLVPASAQGLFVCSLKQILIFDSFNLGVDIPPDTPRYKSCEVGDHLKALVMALRPNERCLIHQVYKEIPQHQMRLVVRDLP